MLKPTSKNATFSEKTVKTHLWDDMAILRGRSHLVTKINVTFFVGNGILNIFHLTIFFKVTTKNNFQET